MSLNPFPGRRKGGNGVRRILKKRECSNFVQPTYKYAVVASVAVRSPSSALGGGGGVLLRSLTHRMGQLGHIMPAPSRRRSVPSQCIELLPFPPIVLHTVVQSCTTSIIFKMSPDNWPSRRDTSHAPVSANHLALLYQLCGSSQRTVRLQP